MEWPLSDELISVRIEEDDVCDSMVGASACFVDDAVLLAVRVEDASALVDMELEELVFVVLCGEEEGALSVLAAEVDEEVLVISPTPGSCLGMLDRRPSRLICGQEAWAT